MIFGLIIIKLTSLSFFIMAATIRFNMLAIKSPPTKVKIAAMGGVENILAYFIPIAICSGGIPSFTIIYSCS
jgi:hypothetical protein